MLARVNLLPADCSESATRFSVHHKNRHRPRTTAPTRQLTSARLSAAAAEPSSRRRARRTSAGRPYQYLPYVARIRRSKRTHYTLPRIALRWHAKNGRLPNYSFIEPRYYNGLAAANDQHPPHSVARGEALIASVYKALQAPNTWPESLLVVLYDEHGGTYDHVTPPAATPPDGHTSKFGFDRYDVQVPAVLISPPSLRRRSFRRRTITPRSLPLCARTSVSTVRTSSSRLTPIWRDNGRRPRCDARLVRASSRILSRTTAAIDQRAGCEKYCTYATQITPVPPIVPPRAVQLEYRCRGQFGERLGDRRWIKQV